jgi:Nucleotidyl transferase AbiEii toxin, Type IV TA system
MISPDSLKTEWINEAAKKHKSDPILVEKVVRALYLLELLQKSKLDFIFKGGTALMLLLPEAKRFSIDIDIIVSEKTDKVQSIFDGIIESSDFHEYKEDKRVVKSKIKKAHYQFFYKTATNTRGESEYILLDILYETSNYGDHTKQIEIASPFLLLEGENTTVIVPTPEAILGDKLTAFAPNTTGVLYGREKEVEIIKQLFDIGQLFDIVGKVEVISAVFNKFAITELSYREMVNSIPKDVLIDIMETAIVIGTRGKGGNGSFPELLTGIKNIRNYIFSESFHLERAMIPAAKSAYLSAILQTESKEINHFSDPMDVADWLIEQPFENRLNKLKKSNPEAFFYWYRAFELLTSNTEN